MILRLSHLGMILWVSTLLALGVMVLICTPIITALSFIFVLMPPNGRFLDRVAFLLLSALFGWATCTVWRTFIIRHEQRTPEQHRQALIQKLKDQIQPYELSSENFTATIVHPMRPMPESSFPEINTDVYLRQLQTALPLPRSSDGFVMLHSYLSADERYQHIHYAFGEEDRCLVLVVNFTVKLILGHYIINLPGGGSVTVGCPVLNPKPPPHLTGFDAKELPSE